MKRLSDHFSDYIQSIQNAVFQFNAGNRRKIVFLSISRLLIQAIIEFEWKL